MGLFPEWQYIAPMLFWLLMFGLLYLAFVGLIYVIDKKTGHKGEPVEKVLAEWQASAQPSWAERLEQSFIQRYFVVVQPGEELEELEENEAQERSNGQAEDAPAAVLLSSSDAASESAAGAVPPDSHAENQPVPALGEPVPTSKESVPTLRELPPPPEAWEVTVAMLATMRDPLDRTKYLFSVNEIKKKVRKRGEDVGLAIAKYRRPLVPAPVKGKSTFTREDLQLEAA